MPRVTIDLSPADMKYVQEELAGGAARTTDELFAMAIQDYRRARSGEKLDRLVEEAMESESIEITPDYWARKKQEFLARRRS